MILRTFLNPDLKVYSTEVLILAELPAEIKPGLSARVEIVVTKLNDVLRVPIQLLAEQLLEVAEAFLQGAFQLDDLPVVSSNVCSILADRCSSRTCSLRASCSSRCWFERSCLNAVILACASAASLTRPSDTWFSSSSRLTASAAMSGELMAKPRTSAANIFLV